MLDGLERSAAGVAFAAPHIPVVSNVSGRLLPPGVAPDAVYIRRHAREPVCFAEGIGALRTEGATVLIEIGPQPTLLGLAAKAEPEARWTALPSLRRGRDDRKEICAAAGGLHVRGAALDWGALQAALPSGRAPLPTYPFQRERYWAQGGTRGDLVPAQQPPGTHPLLGARQQVPGAGAQFLAEIRRDSPSFLADHVVFDTVLLPGTAYVEAALAAGRMLAGGHLELENVAIEAPLALSGDATELLHLAIEPWQRGAATFLVQSAPKGAAFDRPWKVHARGVMRRRGTANAEATARLDTVAQARAQCTSPVDVEAYYARLARAGLAYGPAIRGIARWLWGKMWPSARSKRRPTVPARARLGFCIRRCSMRPFICWALLLPLRVPMLRTASTFRSAWKGYPCGTRGRRSAFKRLHACVLRPPMLRSSWPTCASRMRRAPRSRLSPDCSSGRSRCTRSRAHSRFRVLLAGPMPSAGSRFRVRLPRPNSPPREAMFSSAATTGLPKRWPASFATQVPGANPYPTPSSHRSLSLTSQRYCAVRTVPLAWAVDCGAINKAATSAPETDARMNYLRLLRLARALAEVAPRAGLCLVTRGAQAAAPGEAPALAQAPLLGLARATAAERGGDAPAFRIDIDPRVPSDASLVVLALLELSRTEPELAVRNGELFAARLAGADGTAARLPPGMREVLRFARRGDLGELPVVREKRRAPAAASSKSRSRPPASTSATSSIHWGWYRVPATNSVQSAVARWLRPGTG